MELGPVILFTPAFEESVGFYTAVLGVDPVASGSGFAQFHLGGGVFALHRADAAEARHAALHLHLHFTTHDLDELLERTRAAGILPVEGPTEEAWGREADFRDPAGFRFEVTAPRGR